MPYVDQMQCLEYRQFWIEKFKDALNTTHINQSSVYTHHPAACAIKARLCDGGPVYAFQGRQLHNDQAEAVLKTCFK